MFLCCLLNFNCWIGFDVLLIVRAQISYRPRSEIDFIPHNSSTPAGSKELRKRAVTRLIDAKRFYQGFLVERRHICKAGYQGPALHDNRSLVCQK